MIGVRSLNLKVKDGKELLHELSFDVKRGQVLGVYGPNGSGKSTLLKALSGVDSHREMTGVILVNQNPIQSYLKPSERIQQILYLGSDFKTPFDLSVRELFEMGAEVAARSKGEIAEVVEAMNLLELQTRSFGTLSDGEKQWVMFARVLIQLPEVIVLDESFSKLDLDKLILISKIIRKKAASGTTFLVASHDLNFLSEASDELLFLKQGSLLSHGPVNEVFTLAHLEALYPEVALQVVRSSETGRFKVIY